jgi:TonB family protein
MPQATHAPSHIGRYEVRDVIGAGAVGVVYRCHDPGLNRTVAIKVLRESQFLTPVERAQYEARFRHEAEAASRLRHPGIVKVFDVGPGYLVMELVDGRTLASLLGNGARLAAARAFDIVARVADAIDYAHRHGVVHRDLKPGSVMVTRDAGVKVMDLGVARPDSSTLTALGTVVGSVRYMSPEQMMGDRVDGRADVFSLAAVAYEMLTGVPPFPGKTVTEVVSQVVRGAYAPPHKADARLPQALNAVFARAFAPRPAERLARATELARDLRAAAGPILELEEDAELASEAAPPKAAPPEPIAQAAPSPGAGREALLLLESDPVGEAEVDGRKVGPTPLSLELSFGSHEIRFSAPGRETVAETVELSAETPFEALGVTLPADGGPREGELLAFGPDVSPPRRIAGALPAYPKAARALGLEGLVELELRIDVRGEVREVRLRRSAGAPLDDALLKAVAGWRFAPATDRGAPAEIRLVVRHRFRR